MLLTVAYRLIIITSIACTYVTITSGRRARLYKTDHLAHLRSRKQFTLELRKTDYPNWLARE